MLAVAPEAGVEASSAAQAELVDERGHRLVVGNGHAPARTLPTGWARSRWSAHGWDLSERDYVYCWADGVHFNLAAGRRAAVLFGAGGVRADGTKELVAVADGQHESGDDWAELLRDCRRRGLGRRW